ncbi:nidogen [Wyeomyia smithii]|uniref:nidogen n=1 Tax=Wyeomyia smithii TaxID=174621 RepID=UPI002467B46A|nr:nidogen [Wyeomyia smithii]
MKCYISTDQHGFMPGRSVTTNLLDFTHTCFTQLEAKCQVDVVYTDLKAAFDRIDHRILLRKINLLGASDSFVGSPLIGCRHECESDSECGAQEYCSQFRCLNACSQCGKGATCTHVTHHRALCECPKGYIGSPYSECRAECYGDSECPPGRPACIYGICKNPCDRSCGFNANCKLKGLTPICSCPRDMTGDPFVSCRPFTKEDLCDPNPCGLNAICTPGYDRNNQERPVCTCPAGYTGNALSNCVKGECQSDSMCADNKACVNYMCVDPCAGQCGTGAQCQVKRHIALCTCPVGTQGDALVICRAAKSYPVAKYH